MNNDGGWRHGLFGGCCGGSCGTCMGAWFCSCFLFGRSSQRLERFPDMEKPGLCDGNCWIMCGAGLCHLGWVPALVKRGEMRSKFGIHGDGCTDCLVSYFCYPCTLAQMETEIKDRATAAQGSAMNAGYTPQQQDMTYAPQQQGMAYAPPQQGYNYAPPQQGYNYAQK